jgi:hypothetical protein
LYLISIEKKSIDRLLSMSVYSTASAVISSLGDYLLDGGMVMVKTICLRPVHFPIPT